MIRRPPRSTLFPLHDALPISRRGLIPAEHLFVLLPVAGDDLGDRVTLLGKLPSGLEKPRERQVAQGVDRKSTRLNSSHANISYAVFCLKKKKKESTSTARYTH